jgi:hypothetical protein
MRTLLVLGVLVLIARSFTACKSSSAPASFCDTTCVTDTMKFVKDDHPLKPYVYISANKCLADTLTWSYTDMGNNRKIALASLLGGTVVRLNKNEVGCFIKDTSYAWVSFNDCSNGRGYLLKIPFNKRDKLGVKASAVNGFDPKFKIAEGLIAYSDRGNIFAEDMVTGKTAMMTFGEKLDIDYDAIHEYIDSVNITPTRIWTKVKIGTDWKELEKKIELK